MNEIGHKRSSRTWRLPEACRHLPEIVRLAHRQGPQRIAGEGKEGVVVIAESDYRQLLRSRTGRELVEVMARFPVKEAEIEHESFAGRIRDVEL